MAMLELICSQMKMAHDILEGTMQDVTPEQAQWAPPGAAHTIGANYAHAITGEDGMVSSLLKGGPLLLMTDWAGKTGLSEPPPAPSQGDWDGWARRVQVDLPALREYAQAVYRATDNYLASLSDDNLNRPMDLSGMGMGQQPLNWFLTNITAAHVTMHTGEIACLKGLQGSRGYPF